MSHFSCMVIGVNAEAQLAQFDDNLKVSEFICGEVSEEEKHQMLDFYSKETESAIASFDDCYKRYGEDWNGNRYRKDENGVWLKYTSYNPDSKWDSYSLGGRWSNFFTLKSKSKGACVVRLGKHQAFKKDIDFETMYAEAVEKGRQRYRKVLADCGGVIPRLEFPAPDRRIDIPGSVDLETLWDEYFSQKSVKLFASKVSFDPSEIQLDDFQCTEEEYVQRMQNEAVSTFAYVYNGQWVARGYLDWRSHIVRSVSDDEWYKQMREMVDALPDDTLLSIFDCHI